MEKEAIENNLAQDKIEFDTSTLLPNGQASAGNEGLAVVGKSGHSESGDYGVAVAGAKGTAVAGKRGVAVAGDEGTATTTEWGVAFATGKGLAYSGSNTVNVSESKAYCEGDGGVAVVLEQGEAKVFRMGIAFSGDSGTAIAGDSSIAISSHGENRTEGKASGGNGSIIIFGVKVPDPNPNLGGKIQFHIGIIGDDTPEPKITIKRGLKPNTLYQLDDKHNFVEAPQPKKEKPKNDRRKIKPMKTKN